jgi:hypothetical protein
MMKHKWAQVVAGIIAIGSVCAGIGLLLGSVVYDQMGDTNLQWGMWISFVHAATWALSGYLHEKKYLVASLVVLAIGTMLMAFVVVQESSVWEQSPSVLFEISYVLMVVYLVCCCVGTIASCVMVAVSEE